VLAVWLLLTENDSNYVGEIIGKLSKKYNSPEFLPHLTIYGVVKADLSEIRDVVTNSVTSLTPFTINATGISYEKYIWKSLFIDVELNYDLEVINKRLASSFIKYGSFEFEPHISLLYKNMNESEKKRLISNLEIKGVFEIDKIAIIKFSENVRNWKIIDQLSL